MNYYKYLLAIQYDYFCSLVEENKGVSKGIHNIKGKPFVVYRERTSKIDVSYFSNSPKAESLIKRYETKTMAQKQCEIIMSKWRECFREPIFRMRFPKNNFGNQKLFDYSKNSFKFYGEEFFNKLESNQNNKFIERPSVIGDKSYRSKNEISISQLFDGMGILYKYEPVIESMGVKRSPDFALFFPWFYHCCLMEIYGMSDQGNYAQSIDMKNSFYGNLGFAQGINLITIYLHSDGGIDLNQARIQIESAQLMFLCTIISRLLEAGYKIEDLIVN